MELTELLRVLGGVGSRQTLVQLTSRRELEDALRAGALTRVARGRYAVRGVHQGTAAALRVTGHVCLITAALSYGWPVKTIPDVPHVAVPKDRRLSQESRAAIQPIFTDLGDDDVEGLCTSRSKTLDMCGRRLPFDEALAVADSALRAGFPRKDLLDLAASARGPGSARLRHVAEQADGRAANPFESVLRAIASDVPGLTVEPQVRIRGRLRLDVRPDLVDRRLRVVLEADSFQWHGDRAALRRDARRYDLLVASGWTVLRFAWEDVMHTPGWVRTVLAAVTDERTNRSHARGPHAWPGGASSRSVRTTDLVS